MIEEHGVIIKEDCTRIDGLLYKSCSNVKSKCRKLEGRIRGEYLSRSRQIAIHQGELIKVRLIEEELNLMRENAKELLKENNNLQR